MIISICQLEEVLDNVMAFCLLAVAAILNLC